MSRVYVWGVFVLEPSEPDDVPFQCFLSVIKENSEIFPLLLLDKSELLDLYGVDLPSQLKLLDSYELRSKLANMPNLPRL